MTLYNETHKAIAEKNKPKGVIQMEEKKRGRGRPRLDTHLTEVRGYSRRQTVNSMYMFEAVQ